MKLRLFTISLALICACNCTAHDIVFCGERIPVHQDFVSEKLMNVIRKQIPYVNLPQLRKRAEAYFPIIEYYLRETGLPEDFKYLPIVESGFLNVTSTAGARGPWQLMEATAAQWGLSADERDNFKKATNAACKVLATYYLELKKRFGVSSWVLTAAAYNFGIGNMRSAISKQGKDYFSMKLNAETASYVYKIIAIKELFEYPELYMKDFGYNVFNVIKKNADKPAAVDSTEFTSMVVNVNSTEVKPEKSQFNYLPATIKGKYKRFNDGELVTIELGNDMIVKGSFNRKGNQLKGKGWIIGDRIFIDLGYGGHAVTLVDMSGSKGVSTSDLKNNKPVMLKVINE
jgi:membrane-bound lytic murein transglycosylase D